MQNVMKNRLTGLPLPDVEADRGCEELLLRFGDCFQFVLAQGTIYYKNIYIEQHAGPSDVSIKGSWPNYIEFVVRGLDIV